MHNNTCLYSVGILKYNNSNSNLCVATPMGNLLKIPQNLERVQIWEKVWIFYGSPSIPSILDILLTSNSPFVANNIWRWFLSGHMLWAPLFKTTRRNQDLYMKLKVTNGKTFFSTAPPPTQSPPSHYTQCLKNTGFDQMFFLSKLLEHRGQQKKRNKVRNNDMKNNRTFLY